VNRNTLIVIGIVIGAAVLLATWFFRTYESYETVERTSPGGEARRDPYLAAKRLLDELQVTSRELHAGDWGDVMTSRGGMLIVGPGADLVSTGQIESLNKWIRGGGKVLLIPSLLESKDDAEGNRINSSKDDAVDNHNGAQRISDWYDFHLFRPESDDNASPYQTTSRMVREMGELEVAFLSSKRLTAPPDTQWLSRDAFGACAAELRVGAGSIVALCSLSPFTNDHIGEHQHATVLWNLIKRNGRARHVWWARNTRMPGFHRWLYKHAPLAVLGFAAALTIWMFSRTRRAGPIIDLPDLGRRRTMEHVEASGRFAWRFNGGEVLLDAMRSAFDARLARRQPALKNLSKPERIARLAQAAQLPAESIADALEAPAHDRRDFTNAVRTLRILWRSL
jgi:hypothetical protein